jgi:hypothetical protein
VVGLALVVLVSVGRQPGIRPLWDRLPVAWRPVVPVALGLLAGVGEALATGRPWLVSVLSGLLAGVPALLAALPSQVIHRGPEIVLVPDRSGQSTDVEKGA